MEEEKTKKQKRKDFWKKPRLSLLWSGIVIILLFVLFLLWNSFLRYDTCYVYEEYESYENMDCNVMGIELRGELKTYVLRDEEGKNDRDETSSEDVLWQIYEANKSDNIKYIVVEVDSGGGFPVAGEEIEKAIKYSQKPVFALIRGVGASSSYLAISSADKIWASEFSDIGSIGVTMSYLNEVELNKKEGYELVELNSAKFKDSGSRDKILTNEERELFMRDIKIIHDKLVKKISENRKIPLKEVEKIADGSTVLGERAKELGLIDEVGGIYEVEKYLTEQLETEPVFCW